MVGCLVVDWLGCCLFSVACRAELPTGAVVREPRRSRFATGARSSTAKVRTPRDVGIIINAPDATTRARAFVIHSVLCCVCGGVVVARALQCVASGFASPSRQSTATVACLLWTSRRLRYGVCCDFYCALVVSRRSCVCALWVRVLVFARVCVCACACARVRVRVCVCACVQSLKTKDMQAVLRRHAWSAGSALVVYNDAVDPNTFLACRNVHKLDFMAQRGLNVYDILDHEFLVITQSALDAVTSRLAPEQ